MIWACRRSGSRQGGSCPTLNARLTPAGRLVLVQRIGSGRAVAYVATAWRWWRRFQEDRPAGWWTPRRSRGRIRGALLRRWTRGWWRCGSSSRLRHIGIGKRHNGTPVTLLIADLHIRVINTATGELLRELTLDLTRDCQPRDVKPGPQPAPKCNDVPRHV